MEITETRSIKGRVRQFAFTIEQERTIPIDPSGSIIVAAPRITIKDTSVDDYTVFKDDFAELDNITRVFAEILTVAKSECEPVIGV